MGNEFLLLSRDAQIALNQFSNAFALALVQPGVEQWAQQLGFYQSGKFRTTFPIPLSAAGYKEFLGDVKHRNLFEKSLSLTPKTWQDGVSALASVVEAPDFIGWGTEPAAMAAAGMSLNNEIIATLLEANSATDGEGKTRWDGKAFFATDHPYNVAKVSVGTYSNLITGAGTDPTSTNLATAMINFDKMKAPNGKPLGLRMTHVLHPPSQRDKWKKILEQDLIVQAIGTGTQFGAVDNIYKNSVTPVCSYELTDDSKWYPLALNKPGMMPWIVQDDGAPEELRHDKTSEFYKNTLKIALAYIRRGNGELALPQCAQSWAGTAP